MCNKIILENSGMLKFITDCCSHQKMCDKAVDYYSQELGLVPDCYKTPKCAAKLLILALLCLILFLIDVRINAYSMVSSKECGIAVWQKMNVVEW